MLTNEKIERRNKIICIMLDFTRSIFLGTSVMNTYYTEVYGLTQLQVFWLQATLAGTLVLTDIPFGYLADRFGIRRIIAVGALLQFAESAFFVFCQTFWQFEIALVMTGLYISAASNANSSLMTASVAYIDDSAVRRARYGLYEAQTSRARILGICVGILSGGILVSAWDIRAAYIVQPFVCIITVMLAPWLRTPAHKVRVHATRSNLRAIVRLMLKDRPAVRSIIVLNTVISGCTFAAFWIMQPRLIVAGIAPKYFAVIYFVQYVTTALLTLTNQKIRGKKQQHDLKIWKWSIAASTGMAIIAGLTTSVLPVLIFMLVQAYVLNLVGVLVRDFLHGALPQDPSSRTTELSVMTSIVSSSYIVIGPLIGVLSDHFSVGVALVVIGVFGLGCGYPAYRVFQKNTR